MSKEINHQPRFSEDEDLNKRDTPPPGKKKVFYFFDEKIEELNDLIIKKPNFLDYPETRDFKKTKNFDQVFPDEFVGEDLAEGSFTFGKALPNNIQADPGNPNTILGGDFKNTGGKFNRFLETLRQLCRNYNLDLYNLRQELFEVKHRKANHDRLPHLAYLFKRSANRLTDFLYDNDPNLKEDGDFELLTVEFVKVNNYIASIRAGATEKGKTTTQTELQYSSSSHISISSMYSSYHSSP